MHSVWNVLCELYSVKSMGQNLCNEHVAAANKSKIGYKSELIYAAVVATS